MIIEIDVTSDVPIYKQLRDQIVYGVASGQLREGDALPSVRKLAEQLDINFMTVNKAYQCLREEGIIEIDRRVGASIKACGHERAPFDEEFEKKLTLLLAEAKAKGASDRDIEDYVLKLLESL